MAKRIKLGIDLNEVASKAIQERLQELEDKNKELEDMAHELSKENVSLKNQIIQSEQDTEKVNTFLENVRRVYKDLKPIPEKENSFGKDLKRVKFDFIQNIMSFVFGINPEYGYEHDGGLASNLSANYYNNKKELLFVLDMLDADQSWGKSIKEHIIGFVHPKDYTKDQVLKYVERPHYNTNGSFNGYSTLIKGWGIPHNFIQSSPFIKEPEVFEKILETINKRRGEFRLLFQTYKYSKLSDEQIQQLGESVMPFIKGCGDEIKAFITDNLTKFKKETVDFIFDNYAHHDNQFRMFHWDKFPIEYQYRYLLERPIGEVLSIINHYSCKWTVEEKDIFLKQYYNG